MSEQKSPKKKTVTKVDATPKQKTVGFNPKNSTDSPATTPPMENFAGANRKSKLAGWSSDAELSEKLAVPDETTSPLSTSGSPNSHTTAMKVTQQQQRMKSHKNSPSRSVAMGYDDLLFSDVQPSATTTTPSATTIDTTNSSISSITLETTTESKPENPVKEAKENVEKPATTTLANKDTPKKQKDMTKAERRELQERQRREKEAAKALAAQGKAPAPKPKPAKPAATSTTTTPTNTSHPVVTTQVQTPKQALAASIEEKKKKHTRAEIEKKVMLFSHIPQLEKANDMIAEFRKESVVHPAVINLGLQFAEGKFTGGNARALAMLTVIHDYETPEGSVIQRHLTTYISKQVDFLANIRALAASMRTAVKFLKTEITNLDLKIAEKDAKEYLKERIDGFIRDRIMYAEQAIVDFGLEKTKNGDVIMTYSRSSVVVQLFKNAYESGKQFRVIVVDARPKWEGKETLKQLSSVGIQCTYVYLNAINYVIKEVTKVILGASAVLSNGTVMSRAGSALIAMSAHNNRKPVIIASETYKFSDSVRLDSFAWNEFGDPDELILQKADDSKESVISGWRDIETLNLLNLQYDLMPSQFVSVILCDAGLIPTTSIQKLVDPHPIY
ncbi:hypothetical protein HK098_002474 [Nowakowskiella sp. JEL0407]|nr:hypothetical protein HK098_002474 [Nowakowskiella sp. JEL0407]